MKKILTELNGKVDKLTMKIEGFNIFLSATEE